MTFIKEYLKLKIKADLIVSKKRENECLKNDILNIEREIFRVYEIVFKSFMDKRIETKIELNEGEQKDYWNYFIYLNKDGFSLKQSYDINTKYLREFKNLFKVIQKHKKFYSFIPKKDNQKTLRKFARELLKIKYKTYEINLSLKKPKEILFELNEDKTKINSINIDERYQFDFKQNISQDTEDFYLSTYEIENLKEYKIIEIFNTEMNKLLNMQKKQLLRIKNERNKILLGLRKVFASKLIFDELKKEDS